jgi:hypothetical protein
MEYANHLQVNVAELDTADEYIQVVAWYVSEHMTWVKGEFEWYEYVWQ